MKNIINSSGVISGTFDGEYFYDVNGKMKYRVDNDEVYTLDIPCRLIGHFHGNKFIELNGKIAFTAI